MALLTLTEFLNNYANDKNLVSPGDDDEIQYYQDMLDSAEKMFLEQVDRPLEQASYKEKYCGSGTSNLVLKNYPVASITAVSSSDYTVGDIEIQEEGEITLTDETFEEGRWNHGFIYLAGYLEENMPDDIKDAVGRLAWEMVLQNKRNGDARQGKSETQTHVGDNRTGDIKYLSDLIPQFTKETIEKYKDDRTTTPVERKYS